ncbi:MAG: hypothetical protein K2J80_09250 [Oscillospiraceae bacterium]|nr:hypothetical protein [Oscillospiraceae bacterium]
MSGLTKKKFKIIIIVSTGIFIAAVFVIILVFAPSGYEHIKTFITADNAHKIELYASYPTAPTNARATIKTICTDTSTGKEAELEKFELVIPKTGEVFSLDNDTASGCSIIVHDHRGDKTMELVWNEIFT